MVSLKPSQQRTFQFSTLFTDLKSEIYDFSYLLLNFLLNTHHNLLFLIKLNNLILRRKIILNFTNFFTKRF